MRSFPKNTYKGFESMQLIFLLYLLILGLILGSFYNVVGLRIPNHQSVITPRSHCSTCQRTLTSVELIPVLSYLVLRGKCRTCHSKISILYPAIELLTGLLFLLSGYLFGLTSELFVALAFVSLLMIITVSDINYMVIPDKILLFFLILLIPLRTLSPLAPWWDSLLGAAVGFGLLLLIALISKGGIGGGDVKLFFVIGLVLGTKDTLLAFFLSTLFGSIIGGIGLLTGKVKRREPIPFGPFIVIGALVTYFFGSYIIEWYINWVTITY